MISARLFLSSVEFNKCDTFDGAKKKETIPNRGMRINTKLNSLIDLFCIGFRRKPAGEITEIQDHPICVT